MPVEELWQLHEKILAVLQQKMIKQRQTIDERLKLLSQRNFSRNDIVPATKISAGRSRSTPRRYYPEVKPLYRNPENPSETWSGRGNKPRWLASKLKSGKTVEEFRIPVPADPVRRSPRRNR